MSLEMFSKSCLLFHVLHFHVLQVHVLQFHALHIGPSISRPSFSRPAFSAPPRMRCRFHNETDFHRYFAKFVQRVVYGMGYTVVCGAIFSRWYCYTVYMIG